MAAHKFSFTVYGTFSIALVLILAYSKLSQPVNLNRKFTGVTFSPYVHYRENGSFPSSKKISLESIQAMMSVVSTKFSKVATYGSTAEPVQYRWNFTYHNCRREIYSAEAAALLNRERNETSITIIVGIWLFENLQQMVTEAWLAIEAAEKANKIYPGTAEGLVFFGNNIFTKIDESQQILQNIRTFRKEADQNGLRIGVRYRTCGSLLTERQPEILNSITRAILNESDFLICESIPTNYELDPEDGFGLVKAHFLRVRDVLQSLYSNLEVMGQTQWPSNGSYAWQNIEYMKRYWETANSFASDYNFTMWLLEAIDNPWKNWSDGAAAHFGWWKLTKNSETNLRQGYIEKVSGKIMEPFPLIEKLQSTTENLLQTTQKILTVEKITAKEEQLDIVAKLPFTSENYQSSIFLWVYVGSTVGGVMMLLLVTVSTLLYLRVKRLKSVLTKTDVKEFMVGAHCKNRKTSDETDFAVEYAPVYPYNKSYEISKDALKIDKNALLGIGHFGCVFKARLLKDECDIEVALKMARKNCPRSAVKALLSEIKMLIYLGKHPNIAALHGAYTAELLTGVVYAATEFCSLGSLETYLRKHKRKIYVYSKESLNFGSEVTEIACRNSTHEQVRLSDMIRWSHEIACGMSYLESKHVIHADLATRNVLLTSEKTAKLTDFGLSRRLYNYATYVKKEQEPLPWRWMSVEALKRLEFSSKSDVWSYGITLWEIFSGGDIPYPGVTWNLDFVEKLENGMRMKLPLHASNEVYQIMLECWKLEPKLRPTFSDLRLSVAVLKDLHDNIYTHLFE